MGGRRGGLGYHELNNTDKHNKKREVFFLTTSHIFLLTCNDKVIQTKV